MVEKGGKGIPGKVSPTFVPTVPDPTGKQRTILAQGKLVLSGNVPTVTAKFVVWDMNQGTERQFTAGVSYQIAFQLTYRPPGAAADTTETYGLKTVTP